MNSSPLGIRLVLPPIAMIWQRRELIRQLLVREIVQRYRGSYLGGLWSFLMPLLLLAVYTVVFSAVFKVRWGQADGDEPSEFALMIFAGLIPFNVVAEALSRGPGLVTSVPNYVKKVVFPLEVLAAVAVAAAVVQSLASVLILVLANLALRQTLSPSLVLLPVAYLPLVLFCLGLAWLLSAVGVYIRDVGQAVTAVVQVLVFASPVFYPVSAVPEWLRGGIAANPMTTIIESFRAVLLGTEPMNWAAWAACSVAGLAFMVLGYTWFMLSRNGFADVL